MKAIVAFEMLTRDLRSHHRLQNTDIFFHRTWSYGDVESNGVYYHPVLTNYAHQAFEEYFHRSVGLHYADLSRSSSESDRKRRSHEPPIERMTFPVLWLHQLMLRPMHAGDAFSIAIDTVKLSSPEDQSALDTADQQVGVRAWVCNDDNIVVGVVIWHRCAVALDRGRIPIPIPRWFPTASLRDTGGA